MLAFFNHMLYTHIVGDLIVIEKKLCTLIKMVH